MLCISQADPRLSAHTYLHSNFGFNKTPLAPPGTKAIIYGAPDKRPTFASYDTEVWYIEPTKDHYIC